MNERRADAPSLGVVLAGGVGVLGVVAFVAALAFGGGQQRSPGEKVALVRSDEGLLVLAGRCRDERVVAVEAREGDVVRWRVEASKGSIERRFPVGGEPPFGFRTVVPLAGELPTPAVVAATFDGPDGKLEDSALLAPGEAAAVRLGEAAPPCGDRVDLGTTVLLFAAAAALVVGGYVVMVGRLRRSSR